MTDRAGSERNDGNASGLYVVELVVCPITEPYATQIAYRK